MIWDTETIKRLRTLWDQGHSTAEIGRRLGISKNAACGKAHRLDLPGRSSPIKRGAPKILPPDRAGAVTLPPLASGLPELFSRTLRIAPRINNPNGRAPTTSADDERRIKSLRATGLGYGAISKRTGFSECVVRRVLGCIRRDRVAAPPEPPLIRAVRPVFAAPVVVETVVHRVPDPGQCLWLEGGRPYVQCTAPALAGEGVSRPWSYCQCHRNICFTGRREMVA
jgi:hypothetical protein